MRRRRGSRRARRGVGLDPAQLLLGGAHVAGDGALHLLGEELLGVLVLVRRGPVGVPPAWPTPHRLPQGLDLRLLPGVGLLPLGPLPLLEPPGRRWRPEYSRASRRCSSISTMDVAVRSSPVVGNDHDRPPGPPSGAPVCFPVSRPARWLGSPLPAPRPSPFARIQEEVLQPAQGAEVQVVGRLVQEQRVRPSQEPAASPTRAFSPRRDSPPRAPGPGAPPQTGEDGVDTVLQVVATEALELLCQSGVLFQQGGRLIPRATGLLRRLQARPPPPAPGPPGSGCRWTARGGSGLPGAGRPRRSPWGTICPLSGGVSPARRRRRVDLPTPLGPTRPSGRPPEY